jgi:hypothetical protein
LTTKGVSSPLLPCYHAADGLHQQQQHSITHLHDMPVIPAGKLLGLASESNPQLASLFLRYKVVMPGQTVSCYQALNHATPATRTTMHPWPHALQDLKKVLKNIQRASEGATGEALTMVCHAA